MRPMGRLYAVFFEVKRNGPKGRADYLAEARALSARVAAMSGFLDVERFENKTRPGWLLSLSKWRDESSLLAWRKVFEHRVTQEKGRHGMFKDYRIRVARQVENGGEFTLLDSRSPRVGTGEIQAFVSLTEANHVVALVESPNLTGGSHWQIVRDYGMHDRHQAPHD